MSQNKELQCNKHDKKRSRPVSDQQENSSNDQNSTQKVQNQKKQTFAKSHFESSKQQIQQKTAFQSPIKKQTVKNQPRVQQKLNISQIKQENQNIKISNQKNISHQSHVKSSTKSVYRIKKDNKPFYQETFYITGIKQNYLLLLSDSNQVLQFPIGMFTNNSASQNEHQVEDYEIHEEKQTSLLVKDIKIGQPIKIKLQIDVSRQIRDDQLFNSLQRTLHQQYTQQGIQSVREPKNKRNSQKQGVNYNQARKFHLTHEEPSP